MQTRDKLAPGSKDIAESISTVISGRSDKELGLNVLHLHTRLETLARPLPYLELPDIKGVTPVGSAYTPVWLIKLTLDPCGQVLAQ